MARIIITFAFLTPGCETGIHAADRRLWSIDDSLATRYFVFSQEMPAGLAPTQPGLTFQYFNYSPGGQYFFLVTRQGDIAADCTRFELQVFSVAKVSKALKSRQKNGDWLKPFRQVNMCGDRSGLNNSAIYGAHWVDAGALRFYGVQGNGPRGLYRLDVQSGQLIRVTGDTHDVEVAVAEGGSVVYAARRIIGTDTLLHDQPVVEYTRRIQSYLDLIIRKDYEFEIYAAYDKKTPRKVATAQLLNHNAAFGSGGPWISPDGKWAIMEFAPEGCSQSNWSGYEGLPEDDRYRKTNRYMLIDIQRGRSRPVFDAPVGAATWKTKKIAATTQALWASDSKRVVLLDTALPLDSAHPERSSTSYIVELELDTGKWQIIARARSSNDPMHSVASPGPDPFSGIVYLRGMEWARGEQVLVVKYAMDNAPAVSQAYLRKGGRWLTAAPPDRAQQKFKPTVARTFKEFELVVHQNSSSPPTAFARDETNKIALTGPDPALKSVWLAPVQDVKWVEPNGQSENGGLLLPRDFSATQPPPLVIQLYAYSPDLFWPDGSSTSGYAAQALVAQGMAVLFMDGIEPKTGASLRTVTSQEGELIVQRIDAAVNALGKKELIDPKKIGLIGFSRGGYNTYQAITHPGLTRISAAIIVDAYTGGYPGYLWYGTSSNGSDGYSIEAERQYGGGSFWRNKEAWLQLETSFNVDKVRGAVLFTYHGNVAYRRTDIGAFRLNGRPVDALLFPEGDHQLTKLAERRESLTATVDWFNFWLQGRESTDRNRAIRNKRWRAMRDDWHAVQTREAAGHLVGAPQVEEN